MIADSETGQWKPFDFDRLQSQIPELAKLDCSIDTHAFADPIDSSDMSPAIWGQLARIIEQNYQLFDGFVILHGTDTMSYTASALSFMLQNLAKPVILTGSQLPIGIVRTDGKENLITAIEIAAAWAVDNIDLAVDRLGGHVPDREIFRPLVPEVAIYFEYKLYRGNRTHKYSAEDFDAFHSPNYPLLAQAGVNIVFNHQHIAPPATGNLTVQTELESAVGVLKLFPGITQAFVRAVLSAPGLKGLVLETFGSGNGPSEAWLLESLKSAIDEGIVIVNVTQCAAGRVTMGLYRSGSGFRDVGVVGGSDITTEAALTKLMYLMASPCDPHQIRQKFALPLSGELTVAPPLPSGTLKGIRPL